MPRSPTSTHSELYRFMQQSIDKILYIDDYRKIYVIISFRGTLNRKKTLCSLVTIMLSGQLLKTGDHINVKKFIISRTFELCLKWVSEVNATFHSAFGTCPNKDI